MPQVHDRADAIERLVELLTQPMTRPHPHRTTRPTPASKKRRLEGRKHRGDIKGRRGRGGLDA